MKNSLLIFFLLALFPVGAQETTREIEVRTLCFGYSSGLKELSLAGDKEGASQVDVELKKYLNNSQQPLTIVGDEVLVGELGNETLEFWETVKIAKSMKEVLLVFFPLNDPKKPYRVMAVDDSSKSFPLESYLFANMSPNALRFVVGDSPLEVKPGEFKLLSDFKNVKSNGQVSYYAYYQKGKEWKRLSSGFWDVVPRKRNFQIAFGNPKTKNVELRGYEDSFPVLKELLRKQQQAR